MSARRLVALPYSPWSEKARWALDHHRVAYRSEEYVPMLGEPLLRLRTGRIKGRVTVPVLFDDGLVLGDSFEIARHAERIGKGSSLFPDGALDEIRTWNDRSERAMAAGRALVANRTARDPAAKAESVPRFVPDRARRLAEPLVSLGIGFLRRKYRFDDADAGVFERTIADAMEALRKALGGRPTILAPGFSYADIAMAAALQFVRPPGDAFIRLGPASRACWTDPTLEPQFGDLLEWRDAVYAKHR